MDVIFGKPTSKHSSAVEVSTTRTVSVPDDLTPRARGSGRPERTVPRMRRRPMVDWGLMLVSACFALSGFAALLYETAWLRLFAVVFGTSELALVSVLAGYMGGLAIGAAAAARFVNRLRRPMLLYGLLELGIGLSALGVPWGLRLAQSIFVWWFGGQPELPAAGGLTQTGFYLTAALLILLVPTGLMGATLPVLVRHVVRRDSQVGGRVGWLYGINTAGAVMGTLVTAFLLLPALGLQATVWIGVVVNVLVFGLAYVAFRISRTVATEKSLAETQPAVSAEKPPVKTKRASDSAGAGHRDVQLQWDDLQRARIEGTVNEQASWSLWLMLLSGVVSFTYEVLWTRLLGQILGGSLYAFATMLAAFLAGIALGSAAASWLARTRPRAVAGFAWSQAGIALLSLGTYHLLSILPGWAMWLQAGEPAGLLPNVAIAATVLLPSALCMGATFPFAVRILARDERSAGGAAARLYAWNTVGAIAGAVGAGLALLPRLDFAGTAAVAVGTNLLLALATCVIFWRVSWKPMVGVLTGMVLLGAVPPQWPETILRMSPFLSEPQEGHVVFCKAGRSSTVLLLEREGYYTMRTNGLPEAGIARRGSPPGDWEAHRWLAVLPVLARPQTESMLMVGLGGGTALAGTPQTVRRIDVVELEPEVVTANRAIAKQRDYDPLADPRVRVILNDARSALMLSTKRYDAIVSQPSHPWTAGASHLYTREFAELAQAHLNPSGVFLQWMNSSLVDETLFRSVGATLLDVFPHVRLYRPNPEILLFVASDQPLPIEHNLSEPTSEESGETLFDVLMASSRHELQWLGINSVQDVAAALALEEKGVARLCRGAPVNTDNDNRLALWSPRRLLTAADFDIDELLAPLDPIVDSASRLNSSPLFRPNRVYLARRLANRHLWARAERVAQSISDPASRWLAVGLVAAKRGEADQARRALLESLTLDSDNPNALFAYLEPMLIPLARGQADPAVTQLASSLRGPAAAVVYACRLHAQGDAKKMTDLEPWLAQARPTDTFFTLATNFRAYWRSRVTAPELRRVYAEQALELLDQSLAVDPSLFAALLRVQASATAGQEAALVESIAYVAKLLLTQPEIASPRMIRSTVPLLLKRLDTLASADDSLAGRVAEVRGRLESLAPRPSN